MDDCVSQLFHYITEFMRFNLSYTQKELSASFMEYTKTRPLILQPGSEKQDDSDEEGADEEEPDNLHDVDYEPDTAENEVVARVSILKFCLKNCIP